MKIQVDLKIFLIIILYIFTRKIETLALGFIFIILHEIGHLITGIILGLKIKKIKLNIAGISIEFKNQGKEKLINKIIIDTAGPLVNLISMLIGILIKQNEITYINLGLLIINMLPIYPLDGGRILKNFLLLKKTYKETIRIIEIISKHTLIILSTISSIIILVFKNISIFILIIYLWIIYIKEHRKNKIVKKAYKTMENNL